MMLPESISPELRAFLADWLAWVERGAPNDAPYWRDDGLCDSAYRQFGDTPSVDLELLLRDLFPSSYPYPFGGREGFISEFQSETMHQNPERIAWVQMMLDTYGEDGRQAFNVGPALRQVSTAAAIAATIEWYRAVQFGHGLYDSDEQCASQTGLALGILEDGERQ